mmetsp:Transcript_27682/g.55883  ORF Transcript_27682/g.55883 Transcript_27682/m.55883 type:complete len:128 (-) Transcript_27682:231-614(-)
MKSDKGSKSKGTKSSPIGSMKSGKGKKSKGGTPVVPITIAPTICETDQPTIPPVPPIVTSPPTGSPIVTLTDSPTDVTFEPTPAPTETPTLSPIAAIVTNPPTSGSTPTVSTEVTGPPTLPLREPFN